MKRKIIWMVILMLVLGMAGCAAPEPTEPTAEATAAPTQAPTEATVPPETEAPTEMPTEPTEPEPTDPPEDDELVRVLEYIPGMHQKLAYATEDNFTGQQIYEFYEAYLRYGTVKKLAEANDELAEYGLSLLIWDGFRPVSAQAKLWEICPNEKYVSHPVTGSRSHCRGSAVDVTLVDLETGEELEMPTGFDDFSAYADRDYSDCSEEAAKNAQLLEEVMIRHGFKPYSAEWWHFTDTEGYPVDESFEPPVG